MTAHIAGKTIDSIACSVCLLCGADGEKLYGPLSDRLFSASGSWNLRRCPNRACSLIWLDPMPTELDIDKAYAEYYTHKKTDAGRRGSLRTLYGFIRAGYFAHKYNHDHDATRSWVRWLGFLIYLHPLQKAALDLTATILVRARPMPKSNRPKYPTSIQARDRIPNRSTPIPLIKIGMTSMATIKGAARPNRLMIVFRTSMIRPRVFCKRRYRAQRR